jgi:hypothetical protein
VGSRARRNRRAEARRQAWPGLSCRIGPSHGGRAREREEKAGRKMGRLSWATGRKRSSGRGPTVHGPKIWKISRRTLKIVDFLLKEVAGARFLTFFPVNDLSCTFWICVLNGTIVLHLHMHALCFKLF